MIQLQVPEGFQLPPLFQSLSPEDTARVLVLGSLAFETIQQEGQKSDNESLYISLKKEAAKQYEPQIQQLQKQNTSSTELLSTLKLRLQAEEASRMDVEKRIREEERRNREELLKEKESRIAALEHQVRSSLHSVEQSLKESSRSLSDGFHNFKEQIIKNTTAGSHKKGTQGEAIFTEYLQRIFGSVGIKEEFSLEDVGKEGHQGDVRMFWKEHKLLWEVKNYSRNVNSDEVKKFLRDMEENKDISLGVMVSLKTGITGHQKAGNIDLQELRDGRMCIYINFFLKNDDPSTFLETLKPFIETFLNNRKPETVEESNEAQQQIERFEYQRTILLRLLQNHQESTRKFKNTIANAKKKSDQIWVELTAEMREAENQVKLLVETLVSNTTETSGQVPDFVFTNTDLNMYNEKERKFVEDTLDNFDFSEDYTIGTKQIKEIYKGLGYSEDVVNALRPRVFLEDVWEKGKKEVKYIRAKN